MFNLDDPISYDGIQLLFLSIEYVRMLFRWPGICIRTLEPYVNRCMVGYIIDRYWKAHVKPTTNIALGLHVLIHQVTFCRCLQNKNKPWDLSFKGLALSIPCGQVCRTSKLSLELVFFHVATRPSIIFKPGRLNSLFHGSFDRNTNASFSDGIITDHSGVLQIRTTIENCHNLLREVPLRRL